MSANVHTVSMDEIVEIQQNLTVKSDTDLSGMRILRGLHPTFGDIYVIFSPVGDPAILPIAPLE